MKKRMISLVLAMVLALSLAISASAAESSYTIPAQNPMDSQEEIIPDEVAVKLNPDGTYTLVSTPSPHTQLYNTPEQNESLVYASTERDLDILRLPDGQYLTAAYNDTYVISKRVDLDTSNFAANYSLFEQYDISDDGIQLAKNAIESQIDIGNTDFEFSFYVSDPFTAPTTNSSSVKASNNVEVILTGEARNAMSPHISVSKGASTKNIASTLKSTAISVAGLASSSVSIISTGVSVLKAFESYINSSVTVPLASDWQQIQFKYDWLEKTGYVVSSSHGKLKGCVAQKLWLNTIYYEQFYYNYKSKVLAKNPNSQGVYKTSNYVNKTWTTKSWNDIATIALHNWTTPVIDQPIKATIHGATYVFKKVA